jgi:hypothetical protein
MGDGIDIDMLRLANEETIAIGNMKVNARGDQLGQGGKIIKTRAQIMQEYHQMNTQFAAHDDEIFENAGQTAGEKINSATTNVVQAQAEDIPVAENITTPSYTKPRGSFADALAQQTEVTQELLQPASSRNEPEGIKRI